MDDEERGPVNGEGSNGSAEASKKRGNWGPRGISVSADEDVMDRVQQPERDFRSMGGEFVALVEEDDSEDESAQDANDRPDNNERHIPK